MNTRSNEDDITQPHRPTTHGFGVGRLKRLAVKELRETLRDRRTIITLILMPLLVYPILSIVFRSVLMSSVQTAGGNKPVVLKIAVESNQPDAITSEFLNAFIYRVGLLDSPADETEEPPTEEPPNAPGGVDKTSPIPALTGGANTGGELRFAKFAKHNWFVIEDIASPEEFEQTVATSDISVGLQIVLPARSSNVQWHKGDFTIVQPDTEMGDKAAAYLRKKIEQVNLSEIAAAMRRHGLPDAQPLSLNPVVIAKDANGPPATETFSLAALIPLILVLMTVTGAVYPAIDLTAGERERGTLETLMAAPVPRVGILLAKFVAVWTVAIFTAILNLIGMAITVWTFQFESFLLGPGGFSFILILKIFGLLILFAAFFSAVLLAVTSFARSFKEAQSYLIPIILLSMGPGLLAMTPDLQLTGAWTIVPMVNVLLLGRDVINQNVQLLPAMFAVASTLLYAVLAIGFAARRFGADNILYANQGSFGDLIARPKTKSVYFPRDVALFALILLFPLNLIAIGALGRLAKPLENNYTLLVMLMGLFTAASFFLLPSLLGWYRRVEFKTAFAARWPKLRNVLLAVVLGLFAWPLLMVLVDGWYQVTGLLVGEEMAAARKATLVELTQDQVEKFRQLSPFVVAMVFALTPAFCEEWFFRGMLMQTWLHEDPDDVDFDLTPDAYSDATPDANETSSISKTLNRFPVKAILLSAIAFGFFHVLSNSAISLDRLLPTTLMGVLLGYVCYRSGSIWPGVILHALHNACSAFLGYYQPKLEKLSWFPGEADSIPLTWVAGSLVICTLSIIALTVSNRQQTVNNTKSQTA